MSWSREHDCCVCCRTTERPHAAQGHCMACYRRRRRAGELDRVRDVSVVTWLPNRPLASSSPSTGKWSPVSDACLDCGDDSREHCAHGLCRRCYARRYGREYRQTGHGRGLINAARRRWAVKGTNAEVYRRTARISRDRKFGIGLDIPLGYEGLIFDIFGRRCAACGIERNLVLDHHWPIQDGHPLLHNAVPLCRRCNAKKGVMKPTDFYDGWKLTEIAVLLWETRAAFDERFQVEVGA